MSSNPTTRQFYRRSGPYPQTLQLFDEQIVLKEPTDILIRIHAITLNYRDANMIHGTNPWPVSSNGIPCSDAAGEIIAIGSHVTRFSIGDKVSPILDQKSITGKEQDRLWLGGEVDGVLASHVVFPQENVVKIPEHLSWAEAATLPCAGLTAWSTLAYHGNLVGGKSVLIQGAFALLSEVSRSNVLTRNRNGGRFHHNTQARQSSRLQGHHHLVFRRETSQSPKSSGCWSHRYHQLHHNSRLGRRGRSTERWRWR